MFSVISVLYICHHWIHNKIIRSNSFFGSNPIHSLTIGIIVNSLDPFYNIWIYFTIIGSIPQYLDSFYNHWIHNKILRSMSPFSRSMDPSIGSMSSFIGWIHPLDPCLHSLDPFSNHLSNQQSFRIQSTGIG